MSLFDPSKKNEQTIPPRPRLALGTERTEMNQENATDTSIAVPMDVATFRFKPPNPGPAICNSLEEDGTRSIVIIPRGMTDIDALHALNVESINRYGRMIFSAESIRQLDDWTANHRKPWTHQRTYSVALFVQKTAGRDEFEAERVLDKMRLEPGVKLAPADLVEVAIVLAAHVLRAKGKTPASTLGIRTARSELSLDYSELTGMIHLTKRDPEIRHEHVVTAATPVAAPKRAGFFEFAKALFRIGKAS